MKRKMEKHIFADDDLQAHEAQYGLIGIEGDHIGVERTHAGIGSG